MTSISPIHSISPESLCVVDEGELSHILVVEDDPASQAALATWLAPHFWVRVVGSGSEALASAHAGLDLVLVDHGLPDMDGFELIQRLRARLEIDAAFVMLTASPDPDREVAGFDLGVVDYLHKPIAAKPLLARLRHHLGQHQRRRFQSQQRRFVENLVQRRTHSPDGSELRRREDVALG